MKVTIAQNGRSHLTAKKSQTPNPSDIDIQSVVDQTGVSITILRNYSAHRELFGATPTESELREVANVHKRALAQQTVTDHLRALGATCVALANEADLSLWLFQDGALAIESKGRIRHASPAEAIDALNEIQTSNPELADDMAPFWNVIKAALR